MTRRRSPMWLLAAAPILAAVVFVVVVIRPGDRPVGSIDDETVRRAASPAPASAPASPGPSRVDGLAPGGFEHSQAGAAAAATSYLSALGRLVLASPAERDEALRRIAATNSPGLVAEALRGLALLDDSVTEARSVLPTARVFLRDVPVAYAVGPYHPDRARVDVWSLGVVLIEGRTEATEVWSTNVVELVWERDDWHVWSWTRSPGPVPATRTAQATPPSAVLDAIEGWEGYRYAPSS